jgi:hypothetical protein
VEADVRVLGSSYAAESVFLVVEAESPDRAKGIAEEIVREALPNDEQVHAALVYDEEGNVQ